VAVKAQGKRKTLAGTVAERVTAFGPNVQPLLWMLYALVKDGAWPAEMIVNAKFFADSPLDKKGSRVQKIRGMQAFIDIMTLLEEPT
jgi:hypothetical protein